jgi:nucleotide-binding universal stress UspA family protein
MGGIVVGVDRSPHAVDALRFALDEARLRGAELTVVEVWQQPYLSEDVGPDTASALDEPARKRAEQLLQDLSRSRRPCCSTRRGSRPAPSTRGYSSASAKPGPPTSGIARWSRTAPRSSP